MPLGTASILWNLEKQAQLKGNYSNHQEKLSCMKAQQSWRRFSQNMSWIQLFDVNIVCRCEAALGLNPSSNPPSGAGERCYSCESRWINNISKNMSLKLESYKFLGDFVLAKVSNILKKTSWRCSKFWQIAGASHGGRCPGRRLGIPLNSDVLFCLAQIGFKIWPDAFAYTVYIVKYHTVRDTNGLVNLVLIPSRKYFGLA